MSFWQTIRPTLMVLDKTANVILELAKFRKPQWETISRRWGREREMNIIAKIGCSVLDVIDPTTDDHCKSAMKNEAK